MVKMRAPVLGVLFLLLVLIQSVFGGVIKGKVDFGELPASNLVVKSNSGHQAYVRRDGSFYIRDVPPGVHEIMVVDSLRWFSRALVEIDQDGKQGRIIDVMPPTQPNQGPIRSESKFLVMKPIGMIDYFEKRQQMSIMSLVANPMMLMMLFTLGLGMLMPKMMESLPPEELKQMQEKMAQQQKATADPTGAFASFLGGGGKKSQELSEAEEDDD